MLAGENFDGPHVWYNRRTLPRDSRARLAGRARQTKVRCSRFPELRTPNFELRIAPFSHVSRFTRHGLWRWRTFSASC